MLPPVPPLRSGRRVRAAALALGLGVAGCTRPAGAPPSALPPAGLPDHESWGAVLRISDGGQPRAVLAAPYLARYDQPDSQRVVLRRDPPDTAAVAATLYDQAGAPRARLRADRLTYEEGTRRLVAEGDVTIQATGGRSLAAGRVVWDEPAEQLRVDGAFRFRSPSERVAGVGLVASEDLSRYAFSRASGTLEVEE